MFVCTVNRIGFLEIAIYTYTLFELLYMDETVYICKAISHFGYGKSIKCYMLVCVTCICRHVCESALETSTEENKKIPIKGKKPRNCLGE